MQRQEDNNRVKAGRILVKGRGRDPSRYNARRIMVELRQGEYW